MHLLVSSTVPYRTVLYCTVLYCHLSPAVSERQQSVGSLPGLGDEEADVVPEDGHLQQVR